MVQNEVDDTLQEDLKKLSSKIEYQEHKYIKSDVGKIVVQNISIESC